MANVLYPKGRQHFLEGDIHWLTDTIKAMLVDTGVYTYSDSHEFLSSVEAARIGTDQTLSGKTSTDGIADSADPTFPAVTGATVEALVLYRDSEASPQDAASCELIAYIDDATGLPFTPDGGDRRIVWSDGANKIFKL